MIGFDWPWLFLALPLPLLLRRLLPAAEKTEEAALRVPSLAPFAGDGAAKTGRLKGRRWPLWLSALAWLLLVSAAARPVWLGDPVELPVSGRDLMLAVDLSGSMQTQDFVIDGKAVSRLAAIKKIAGKFIERRVGDRLGLILFGSQAYVQTPLTFDRKTVNSLLQEAAIGLAGDQTAIGDAIGLAVKRLAQRPRGNKVLILLTDGGNDAGELAPIEAAKLAAQAGLTIYTIGVGAKEMLVPSLFGSQRINPSSDLDEKTLRAIAAATGGRYFRASDSNGLNQIYAILDKLQPIDHAPQTFRPRRTLFYWPLAVSLLLATALLLAKLRG
ncbi:von Willebrand factor type A domain protein [mine drainage metagenome]|uniref:von Willebrand factor type A domain protein n=1 Tax=mine drainage metagenome TaxID=410659 RepID=A0A1J5RQ46_9ZZZZ